MVKKFKLKDYKDKVIVVVNVASRCGYTPQYEDLQKLWLDYKEKNLVVIGIPTNNFRQEPGTNKEIKDFCETNFGINFPMTEKTNVIGKNAHPFYKWAKKIMVLVQFQNGIFTKLLLVKMEKLLILLLHLQNHHQKNF